jgi:hypothetical protein
VSLLSAIACGCWTRSLLWLAQLRQAFPLAPLNPLRPQVPNSRPSAAREEVFAGMEWLGIHIDT